MHQNSLDTPDYVSYTVDNEKQALTNQFNISRTKINMTNYDWAGEISENELHELIEEVRIFWSPIYSYDKWQNEHSK